MAQDYYTIEKVLQYLESNFTNQPKSSVWDLPLKETSAYVTVSCRRRERTMPEENKDLIRCVWDEIFNKGNLDAIDENFAPDAVFPAAPPGISPHLSRKRGR